MLFHLVKNCPLQTKKKMLSNTRSNYSIAIILPLGNLDKLIQQLIPNNNYFIADQQFPIFLTFIVIRLIFTNTVINCFKLD